MATGSNFVSKNTFYQCRSGKTSSGNFFDTPIEKSRVQKSWDIFSAMGCHATCWKLFQSFPLLELCEMTVIAFDVVYGFFDLYHVFTYYWIDSIADYNLARSTRIKCPHLWLFEKKLDLDNFSQKWQQVQRTLDIEKKISTGLKKTNIHLHIHLHIHFFKNSALTWWSNWWCYEQEVQNFSVGHWKNVLGLQFLKWYGTFL